MQKAAAFCIGLSIWGVIAPAARAEDQFPTAIQPLLKKYCLECHSTAEPQGELDLERFKSLGDAKRAPDVWQKAIEQLAAGEMPPKDQPQPTAEEKRLLTRWAQTTLHEIALASAGDPGPVVLRRLSNAEYVYSLRDLTGVASLDPAHEFPVDGAAGEGFTNAAAALVMSPALLTKYLDAAKEVAGHAVLGPDGIRFSAYSSPRDWTDENLSLIRQLYAQHSATGGATAVNLQGIQFDTNAGGRLAVEKYIAAVLHARDALIAGKTDLAAVAKASGLNAKYLSLLWTGLSAKNPSPVLDQVRAAFAQAAPDKPAPVVEAIEAWQRSLWRFASVGHIGKKNGPVGWQEPVTPLAVRHEMRLKLAPPPGASDFTLYLSTSDAGDGVEQDLALWENARVVAAGRPDLPLAKVRGMMQQLDKRRAAVVASTAKCLAAAAESDEAKEKPSAAQLAQKHGVEAETLTAWLNYLGLDVAGAVKLGPPIVGKHVPPEYAFVRGWTGADALSVIANSSDTDVNIPGKLKAHSVVTHPAPKVNSVIAWRSPIAGALKIDAFVQDAHTACGNGVTWLVEVRRGGVRVALGHGATEGDKPIAIGPFNDVRVAVGDVVALVVGPKSNDHVCDLTAIDLTLSDGKQEWSLAKDVSPDILAGNPHADRLGNKEVWHFVGEPTTAEAAGPVIPAGSLVAQWRGANNFVDREQLAEQIQQLLAKDVADVPADSPNRALQQQLLAWNGPLLASVMRTPLAEIQDDGTASPYGLDPARFGKQPAGGEAPAGALCVQAPSVLEVKLPATLLAGAEFVVSGRLFAPDSEGSVQMEVLTQKPERTSGIAAGQAQAQIAPGKWSDNNLRTAFSAPVIVNEKSAARKKLEATFDDFRALFPAALCYTKIVPVDEVVTLTLFYREDHQLKRLMLDDAQAARLDRLWSELLFVSETPLKQVEAYDQLWQYATQDADPSAFEPLRKPILDAAAAYKKQASAAEPLHVAAVLSLAATAWRRPVSDREQGELQELYARFRSEGLKHEAAVRMLIARVLVAPAFLYRGDTPQLGVKATPVSDGELATRLSYFLWSSAPDAELRQLAASGALHEDGVLVAQTRRMLKDPKVRRLALEFGCQWLNIRDLDTLDEKSERHFPTFTSVRGDMLEESARYFTDLFQTNGSVLSLLDSDHTFVNGALAKHYGLAVGGDDWRRVEGLRAQGRGGLLGFAATLAKQSGASRTSPILRGNWVSETLLGEKLPKPPKDVPILPEETPAGLSERQLIERHSSYQKCAKCHAKIDPYGFSLEGFDAIGRWRAKDAAGAPIDTRVTLHGGPAIDGLAGLRGYLVEQRRDDFLRQFCRKLVGYSLGRGVQLSDQPLIDAMVKKLSTGEGRIGEAIEAIVLSPQFRQVRGRDFVSVDDHN